MVPEILIQLD